MTVTLPLAAPGFMAGALFAFTTSFDEVVAALFSPPRIHHTTCYAVFWPARSLAADTGRGGIAAITDQLCIARTDALVTAARKTRKTLKFR
ncbi:hypothetical protein HGG76_21230 [Ochrobactrum tritici]|uniref:Uncharacterized protein n=1 Tax=Brucella tritici TaxID=94626 RepID=A0A7X6JBC8_9HYPH|nr:hypothetical protein [Brucella tritici]